MIVCIGRSCRGGCVDELWERKDKKPKYHRLSEADTPPAKKVMARVEKTTKAAKTDSTDCVAAVG